MLNAKEELQAVLQENNLTLVAVSVSTRGGRAIELSVQDSKDDSKVSEFLNTLDFEYDNGYGWQYIYGTVWCKDSKGKMTWLSRGEYDGSEWWELNALPKIPKHLK